jgi:lysyl-tRNA synthetase class I
MSRANGKKTQNERRLKHLRKRFKDLSEMTRKEEVEEKLQHKIRFLDDINKKKISFSTLERSEID